AKDMKVYPDDKVFTGPIWLYVGKTPIIALPFMANSISHGRRSGFLRPDIEFGITNDSNRFIRGLGYYWATNDYTDFTFVTDFDEDVRWRMYIGNRYAWRYKLNGDVNYIYDVDRYIDRQIRSTARLSKSWKTTAVSVSGTRNQKLNVTDTEAPRVELTAPDIQ